jgi:NAD(P)-dependent dehydrogenase (short-subunit alcohol dehydrogenase family)
MTKTALVTGAARGIGLALCRTLRDRGRRVIAVCRHRSPELAALAGADPEVRIEEGVDVTSYEALAALERRLADVAVRIEELICNAGILREDDLDHLSFDEIRDQFEVNALGPLRTVRALRGSLGAGSKVALITSRMGSIADNGSGGYYGYRMSKAALNIAGVSLAHDLAPDGVAVVILHPGYVRTDMTDRQGNIEPAEAARQLVDRIDALTAESSGRFLHANGQPLPW